MISFAKPKMTKEQWRLAILGGLLGMLAVCVYFSMLVVPSFQRIGKLGQEVSEAKEQLTMLERVLANEERIREQHERLGQTVASLRDILPAEEELPIIIEKLSELARVANVKILTIFPKLDISKSFNAQHGEKDNETRVYRAIPIQMDAVAGYHSIGQFMSLVESLSIPIEVTVLRISHSPQLFREHAMRLVLNIFFATNEPSESGPIR